MGDISVVFRNNPYKYKTAFRNKLPAFTSFVKWLASSLV